ncbi:DNA replication protein [Salmonella enterica]|uniref:DNA replication protein n=2 Tax=Enterobacteriaceae TaxID=543 RepID=A0A762NV82_SALER|nr:DNA replication protein [Salmonella enterica]EBG0226389.1 DNA replication protein [Salmonella enterica subsp. enterica serovar Mbandaka]EBS2256044.1 DNA replication protein [Salmonella enterica subsp. enterica serovar Infantis]ECA3588377.1 DNA replication protein [Salmonella enterica subsp. enterica serovar Oranienburg]QQL64555.1 DNA replication protein [Salmonella enterica subsp. enterica serovar Othmarschen]
MSNISNLAEAREARRLQQPHQSSGKGYALLHRKIMDVPFYKDAEAAHLWVHLILKAKHTPEYVMTDAGEILVGRGKLLGGRNSLAFETGLKPDRVQYLLRKFKKLGMIDWVSHGKFSVFSVEKYDDYQSNFVPADYQQITTSKPAIPMPASNTVPADYQQITTDKEYNNIISNTDVLESATADKKSDKKKPSVSCQDVVDAYHEILPEAPRIRALNDKRKNQIRTFWRKAGVITRQLDGHGFSMQDWRNYLSYVGENCRWMFEERQNHQRGTVWHKKGFDFLLNDNTYLKVREGEHDDR